MRGAAILALLVASAGPALAAGEGEGGIGDLFYPALNLAILIAVLVYFGRKPIRAFFAERRAQIQDDLKRASELRAEAEARYAKWQRRLVDLDAELEGIRVAVRERAEAERERILEEATAAADRIRNDALAAVEQELRRARRKLREEASELAIEIAGERLREQVSAGDRDRLFDEFIERIEGAPTGDDASGGSGRS
jgi:F-type H+-transporting ATPase subunit b